MITDMRSNKLTQLSSIHWNFQVQTTEIMLIFFRYWNLLISNYPAAGGSFKRITYNPILKISLQHKGTTLLIHMETVSPGKYRLMSRSVNQAVASLFDLKWNKNEFSIRYVESLLYSYLYLSNIAEKLSGFLQRKELVMKKSGKSFTLRSDAVLIVFPVT